MLHADKLEVDELSHGPNQVVRSQRCKVTLVELVSRAFAFKQRHARQKDTGSDRCEDELIASHPGYKSLVHFSKVNPASNEPIPCRSCGPEHDCCELEADWLKTREAILTAPVECHPAGSPPFMGFGFLFLDKLLGRDITCGKECAGCDALSEKRRGAKTALVPAAV